MCDHRMCNTHAHTEHLFCCYHPSAIEPWMEMTHEPDKDTDRRADTRQKHREGTVKICKLGWNFRCFNPTPKAKSSPLESPARAAHCQTLSQNKGNGSGADSNTPRAFGPAARKAMPYTRWTVLHVTTQTQTAIWILIHWKVSSSNSSSSSSSQHRSYVCNSMMMFSMMMFSMMMFATLWCGHGTNNCGLTVGSRYKSVAKWHSREQ